MVAYPEIVEHARSFGICVTNKLHLKVAYRDERGPRQYQQIDVSDLNLKCAGCSMDIKELPFRPTMNEDGTPARQVYCRDCKRSPRQSQQIDVSDLNLKCAGCSIDIKELPFRPMMNNEDNAPARPVYCRDCNAKRRQTFQR